MADANRLSRLITELGYPTEPEDMFTRLSGLLSDETYAALVAEREGLVVGMAGVRIGRYFEKNGLYAQLVVLVVSAEVHGSGVGTILLEAAERWAASRGAREMIVNSGSHRVEAHQFYRSRGFDQTGFRFKKTLV